MKKCVVDFFLRFVLKWLAIVKEFSKALTWFTNWIDKQLFGCFFIIGRIRLTKMISSSGNNCKYLLLAFNSFFTPLKDLILLITFPNSTSAGLQVNLCQKLSLLNQLTQNMTRNCSLNFSEKYKLTKCCVQIFFWMSKQKKNQFLYTACSELVFFGEFNEQSQNLKKIYL